MATKSLSEQTNEILKSTMSANKKAQALVKIGVTPYEAMVLARTSMVVRKPRPRTVAFAYTFGVEIECVNCEHSAFFTAAQRNGIEVFNQVYYNHSDMPVYKLTTDSSLSGYNTAECVTPPLDGDDNGFGSLKACCKALGEIGATVNSSCGLHVHIGAASLTDEEYCNVFVNYMRLETAINSILAPSRRASDGRWCKSLRNREWYVLNASTKDEMLSALHNDRYYRVNAKAYTAHKTIEFRQHQGSTNFAKISHWVRFLASLVEYSKTHRLTKNIDRIEDIPFLKQADKVYFIARRREFEERQGA